MEYDNDNQGALWKGKKDSATHPDYTGTITIKGEEYWLSAWANDPKNAHAPVIRLKIKLKDEDIPF